MPLSNNLEPRKCPRRRHIRPGRSVLRDIGFPTAIIRCYTMLYHIEVYTKYHMGVSSYLTSQPWPVLHVLCLRCQRSLQISTCPNLAMLDIYRCAAITAPSSCGKASAVLHVRFRYLLQFKELCVGSGSSPSDAFGQNRLHIRGPMTRLHNVATAVRIRVLHVGRRVT